MPPSGKDLRGLKSIVEFASRDIRYARPNSARQHDPLLVPRNPGLVPAVPVVLDDHDRIVSSRRYLDPKDMRSEFLWSAVIDGLIPLAHCSASPCSNSMPSLIAKSFRSWPEEKCAFLKIIVIGASGVNFSSIFSSSAVMNAPSTRTSPTAMFATLL